MLRATFKHKFQCEIIEGIIFFMWHMRIIPGHIQRDIKGSRINTKYFHYNTKNKPNNGRSFIVLGEDSCLRIGSLFVVIIPMALRVGGSTGRG